MAELRYLMLFVSDLERSLRFYSDALGLAVKSEGRDMVEFTGGLTIHQAHQEGPHHHPPMVCGAMRAGFQVPDLEAVHARLLADGAKCLTPPEERQGVRMALYEDPDGFNITVAQVAS